MSTSLAAQARRLLAESVLEPDEHRASLLRFYAVVLDPTIILPPAPPLADAILGRRQRQAREEREAAVRDEREDPAA